MPEQPTRDELIARNPWMTLRITLMDETLWEYQVLGHWMATESDTWRWKPNGPDNTVSIFMLREVNGDRYEAIGEGVMKIAIDHVFTGETFQRFLEERMKP